MSCYLRPRVPGGTVFFTVCLAEAGSSLLVDEVERLRRAVRQTIAERPFAVRAWVVLPDHMHCVWDLPEGDSDYSTRWGAIKARFSQGLPERRVRVSHVLRREKAIWQRRFWEHHCRGEAEVAGWVRYCATDPVRHGLVARPQDWPWSSVRRDADRVGA
jgi:putative transposase